jgi:hypothetical protein
MTRRGLSFALLAVLVLFPFACAGDDEEAVPRSATAPSPATTTASAATTAPEQSTTSGAAGVETASRAVLTDAAAATSGAGTARVGTSVTLGGGADGEQTFGGEGVFDFQHQSGEVTLDLTGLQLPGTGSTRLVFDDYVVYYELGEGILLPGKRWLGLDLQSLGDASGIDLESLVQGTQADPSQLLLWLGAIGPAVEKVGEETVRGVETTRYRAVVDLERLEAQPPAGRGAEWAAYVQALKARLGASDVPVEIWLDGDGLLRRLRQEYGFGGGAAAVSTTITMELYDFGVEVDVERPPPDEVALIGDLIRP